MIYVGAAYSIVLVLILAYALILGQRQSKLLQEVRMLQKAVAKKEGREGRVDSH